MKRIEISDLSFGAEAEVKNNDRAEATVRTYLRRAGAKTL
jgi:hypothetical protein